MASNKMTLYFNTVCGKAENASYPFSVTVHNANELQTVVTHDHVSAQYKNNHRQNANFIKADCTMLDVDNTHSDNEKEWVTPDHIRNAFPNVAFYVSYSRNHMKSKNGKSPRPKFHLYFPDREFNSGEEYSRHKEKVCAYFPYFDTKAKDIAHFFYGVTSPNVQHFDGDILLSDFMETVKTDTIYENTLQVKDMAEQRTPFVSLKNYNCIPSGARNSTLHQIALKLLKRLGATEEAQQLFLQNNLRCQPPLSEKEVNEIWKGALKYYHEIIKTASDYIPPEQYHSEKSLKPTDYTDVGQAYIFVREYGDRVRFSPATNYLYYTGKVWVESETKVHRLVQEFTDLQLKDACAELKEAQKEENESVLNKDDVRKKKAEKAISEAKLYRKFVLSRRDTLKIRAVLTEAKPIIEIGNSCLDAIAYMLNTPAGTVDLRTKEIHEHDPADYCTKITAAHPTQDGAELFSDFLTVITCENKELEEYLQLIAGMFAVGAVYRENLVIAYGSGRNGKSTFFNLLAKVLGDYSGNLSAETLTVNSRKNKSPEYAELRGKRLVIAAELQEGMRLDTSIVKKLCSTDPIYAEKKYKDPFSFIPSHTVVLYTNHLPNVGSSDNGTWRRLVVIPFNAVIPEGNDIKNYADYLFDQAGGAVLSWIIEGAYKFIKAEYTIHEPEIVKHAIAEYRAANDWLNNYITECCEIDKAFSQNAGELYENYRNYCQRNGEYTRSSKAFKEALEGIGYAHHRNNSHRYWTGLRLLSQNKAIDIPYVSPPQKIWNNEPPNLLDVTIGDVNNEIYTEEEEVEF